MGVFLASFAAASNISHKLHKLIKQQNFQLLLIHIPAVSEKKEDTRFYI